MVSYDNRRVIYFLYFSSVVVWLNSLEPEYLQNLFCLSSISHFHRNWRGRSLSWWPPTKTVHQSHGPTRPKPRSCSQGFHYGMSFYGPDLKSIISVLVLCWWLFDIGFTKRQHVGMPSFQLSLWLFVLTCGLCIWRFTLYQITKTLGDQIGPGKMFLFGFTHHHARLFQLTNGLSTGTRCQQSISWSRRATAAGDYLLGHIV